MSENETQLNFINITQLQLNDEYQLLVMALNDVGQTASDYIRVIVGMPYVEFGILSLIF